MKTLLLALTLLLIHAVCLSAPVAADEHSRDTLEKEALKFATGYVAKGNVPPKPEQAKTLRRAGDIMTAAKQCSAAMSLYKQAALFSGKPNAELWLSLAEAAGCAKKWPAASRSGWLAYLAAENNGIRKAALSLTGTALEKRTSYSRNWTPAAISVYALLNTLDNSKQNAKKLARVRKKQADDQALKIQKYFADNSSGHPRLCISFNDSLPKADTAHYGDYVRITPALTADFSVEHSKLCIGGAAYGTTYSLTMRKGLKGKKKELRDVASFTIETGHSPPAVWFNQNDYILADAAGAVALHTVNVDKVRCRLFRIHERNILGDFVQNQFRNKLNQYQLENITNKEGEQIWEGTAEISSVQDEKTASSLVLPEDALAAPGLYVLVAEDGDTGSKRRKRWEGRASQWLVKTDIGLTSYQGNDGLTVIARSLATALPVSGLEIVLYARNNNPLATLTTDETGKIRFAHGLLRGKGGQKAVQLVSADSKYGFTFLQIDQAPFDLSDRGVGGRAAPGSVDAFVYTERGIYRPGESVNIVALVRDQLGRAIDGPPLTMRIKGADAKIKMERLLPPDSSGGYIDKINLPSSARSGTWTAALYVDVEEKPVGQVRFQVKSFKPPRLEARLEPEGILTAQDEAKAIVQADYLYGSPGSDLRVQARMSLQYDPHPFADFATFFFGRAGENPGIGDIDLPEIRTDDKGRGTLSLHLDGQQESTMQPLKAVIHADVMDIDGRTVSAVAGMPVRHLEEYLGVKPGFADEQVQADSDAGFEIIALDAKGSPRDEGQIKYRLVREEIDYQWFQKNGKWGYERIVRDQEEERDQLAWEQVGPMRLSLPVKRGSYRLELLSADNNDKAALLTSFRFVAGEQLVGKSDTPDAVKVTLDRQQYQAGDVAKLTVTSPYPGRASLVLANSSIHGVRNFPLTEVDSQEHTLEIPIEADWGAGVYALVTVYRPGYEQKKGADRAVGLVWLNVDPKEQRLEVAINSPDQIRPRQTLQVPVVVKDAEPGQTVRLTLAAVDDGVLQLTDYVSPDPLAWFFNKQQLGLEIRDLYGQLITPPEGKPLILRTGAGEEGLRGSPESNVRVVSLFSGAVQAGEDGIATVPLEIPDFNGRLRLMAVAWSKAKLGSASRDLQINDPVVVSPSLPRYLAQGDQSSIQLLLENIDGPAGEYKIAWKAEGAVAMGMATEPAGSTEAAENTDAATTVSLEPGKRQNMPFYVRADNIGKGSLHVDVSGPEGYSYAGDFPLNVRGKYLPTLSRGYAKLDPGAVITLDKEAISGLFPATAEVALSISSSPNLDVAGLLAQLDRYPHGCLEQLTSRAMPLLYANLLAERFAYPVDKELPGRVQEAVDRILQKQLGEGSFSLWSDNGEAKPWLSAYAMDFLSRAGNKGYAVPEYFYTKGMQWLTDQVKNAHNLGEKQLAALAYAHWVLARAGQGRHEDARYLFDTWFAKISSPLSQAQLAGALALQGDQGRAVKGLRAALLASSDTSVSSWRSYGSRLRDLAGIIHVIDESGTNQADPAPAWEELTRLLSTKKYLSTQEQAWLIMAALTLEQSGPLDLDIIEETVKKEEKPEKEPEKTSSSLLSRIRAALNLDTSSPPEPETASETEGEKPEKNTTFFSLSRDGDSLLTSPVTVKNNGEKAVWLVTVVQGSPIDEPEPVENGFTIWRQWYSTAGKPLPAETVPQGQLVVVTLEGEVAAGSNFQALLVDLLPAGFEIEQPITGKESTFHWLDDLSSTRYIDARDDRFVAAFDTNRLDKVEENQRMRQFRLAYLVRAVTPGTYTLPPSEVEAMYRPEYRARSGVGEVTVSREE